MGAEAFVQYQQGRDAEEAFAAAVGEARFVLGAGGYTGSIAEKGEYRIAQRRPVGRTEAKSRAEELLDDDRFSDKWGPAGAIPVCAEHGRFETVSVTVVPGPGQYGTEQHLMAQLRTRASRVAETKVRPREGERVVGTTGVGNPVVDAGYKTLTGSKRVTRYYVRGLLCDRPFDTQAQARAWATDQLDAMAQAGRPRLSPVHIQAVTERADGSDLVRIVPQVKSVTFPVDVAISRAVDTVVTGWVFFGWASS